MLTRADILMIGSTGRNVGKTLLASSLIRRHASSTAMAAVKVTTIHEQGGLCPHGGDGCGVCSSFEGDYILTIERDGPPDKDTTRLISAGASRVFWLRVREAHLAEGIAALLKELPSGQPVIMESNSARLALEPSLFLVLRQGGSSEMKESCRSVLGEADRILTFDGAGWDLSEDRISFSGGRWWVRQDAAAIVLAGGQSVRMGQDKNFLPMQGRPMVQHIVEQLSPWFDEVMIGANSPEKFAFLKRRVIVDHRPGMGPLMGIVSCLSASKHELNFITACDVPVLNPHFMMQMVQAAAGVDIAVPVSPEGRPEPLLAVYQKSVVRAAEEVLQSGGRRISDLFGVVKVKFVTMSDSGWYRNLNTMDDYRCAVTADVDGRKP